MASSGNDAGAPAGCGSHTATALPDPARGNLYLYVGGSSGACQGIDIVRINITDPTNAVFVRRAPAGRQCHDNNVILGSVNMAVCAGGNGFSLLKFDPALDPAAVGGIENPTLVRSVAPTVPTAPPNSVGIGHSATFSYDGKTVIFGHEPGGGSGARCETSDTIVDKTLFFYSTANLSDESQTVEPVGKLLHARPQTGTENCTWHNFNVAPTYKGYYAVSGSYEMGISVFDFTNPQAVEQIGRASL